MTGHRDPGAAVSQRLDTFFDAQERHAAAIDPLAADFVRAAREAVHGGKRLRARFCVEGWRAIAELRDGIAAPGDDVITAAAALEVFHAAALVHDDLVDNSDTRRGRPARHRAFEATHRERAWTGDAAEFGRAAAVLVGDLLVAASDDLLEEGLTLAAPPVAAAARREYARMRREVTLGQLLDVAAEQTPLGPPDPADLRRALRIAEFKSARYSVQQPLLLGAALAGADAAQTAALDAFGLPLGIAFQLRDDVLGIFGDEAATGKPSGDDLREGKRTVLIAEARAALDADARMTLDAVLGDRDATASEIATAQGLLRASGALARIEARISEHADAATRVLEDAPLAEGPARRLAALLRAATERAA